MKMKANPILEELWRTKDQLALEAGDDVRRICENTRRWATTHPPHGPRVHDATELRAWLAEQEEADLAVVREDAPPYGNPEKKRRQ